MKFALPCYEIKYRGEKYWEDISEPALMQRLPDTFDRVTPVIRQMLKGKQVQTPEAVYRLKKER